jgi:hypothetical protein
MYKPSSYLVITYFPTYLPKCETYFLQNWLPRWNQILTQLRFIHNWVLPGIIQWMVHGLVSVGSPWLGNWACMGGVEGGENLANFPIELVKRDLSNEESNALKLRWGLCSKNFTKLITSLSCVIVLNCLLGP